MLALTKPSPARCSSFSRFLVSVRTWSSGAENVGSCIALSAASSGRHPPFFYGSPYIAPTPVLFGFGFFLSFRSMALYHKSLENASWILVNPPSFPFSLGSNRGDFFFGEDVLKHSLFSLAGPPCGEPFRQKSGSMAFLFSSHWSAKSQRRPIVTPPFPMSVISPVLRTSHRQSSHRCSSFDFGSWDVRRVTPVPDAFVGSVSLVTAPRYLFFLP